MKRALISDIHGNLEALQAVLDDIRDQGISEIYCLGDVIGYGPNPAECVDKIINCDVTILGNHDQAVLFDPDGFNPVALQAILWTRQQLERKSKSNSNGFDYCDFLGELPRNHRDGDFLFVHGSPRDPTNEYVFPEDVYNQRKMEHLFSRFDRYCFQGHTHVPGVFTPNLEFISPDDCDYQYQLGEEQVMVNVGSVGQPRDGDSRACYVILTDQLVTFRRIEYPVDVTSGKIYAISDLDNMLGDRLHGGR